jgi:hypothetical protein
VCAFSFARSSFPKLTKAEGKKILARKLKQLDQDQQSQKKWVTALFATIDGNDNVWISNFAAPNSPITELCGVRTESCPPGMKTGDQISPPVVTWEEACK